MKSLFMGSEIIFKRLSTKKAEMLLFNQ